MFPYRRLLDEVAKLGLPNPGEVVLTYGTAMVTRGLRDEDTDTDIDIVTSLRNRQFLLRERGFHAVTVPVNTGDSPVIRDVYGRYDVWPWAFSHELDTRKGNGRIQLPELYTLSDQDHETGIWVASLELIRLTKLQTGRQKDIDDVALIDTYLNQ